MASKDNPQSEICPAITGADIDCNWILSRKGALLDTIKIFRDIISRPLDSRSCRGDLYESYGDRVVRTRNLPFDSAV